MIGPSEGVRLRLPLTGAVTYSLSLAPRPKRTVFGGHDPVVLRGGMGARWARWVIVAWLAFHVVVGTLDSWREAAPLTCGWLSVTWPPAK